MCAEECCALWVKYVNVETSSAENAKKISRMCHRHYCGIFAVRREDCIFTITMATFDVRWRSFDANCILPCESIREPFVRTNFRCST